MPIKDAHCLDCDAVNEHFLKMNEEPTNCKTCNSENVVPLIGASALRFKGKDWYCTTYKRNTGRNRDILSEKQQKDLGYD